MLLALLLASDFFGRVYVSRDAELRRFSPPPVPPMPSRLDAEHVTAKLAAWFPEPAKEDVQPEKSLSLRGVLISRGARKAVVAVVSASGTVEGYQLVSEGQQIENWTVAQIKRVSVSVVRDGETRELQMFPARSKEGIQ